LSRHGEQWLQTNDPSHFMSNFPEEEFLGRSDPLPPREPKANVIGPPTQKLFWGRVACSGQSAMLSVVGRPAAPTAFVSKVPVSVNFAARRAFGVQMRQCGTYLPA
jgi:hypothetical protein